MNITIVGHVCIDHNESENSSYSTAGSPAVFMNRIFKQLPDCFVSIIAPYGKDFLQYSHGLNLFPKNPTSDVTLVYENISTRNVRTQKAHNTIQAVPPQLDVEMQKILQNSDVILISPQSPAFSSEYLKQAFAYTSEKSIKILSPQGYFRNFDREDNVVVREFVEADEILPLIDVMIVSIEDHSNIMNLAKKWQEYGTIIIVTQGEKGSMALSKGEEVWAQADPVPKEKIIDSVGSGDIFSAAFAYDHFLYKDLKKALDFANNIARQCLFFTPDEIKIKLD